MAVINLTKTVVGVFDRMEDANNVVRELENAGFARDEISVIANKTATGYADETAAAGSPERDSNVAADAGIGAALGGVGGLLLSFATLAIPGVGPVLAIGPIVAALSGAGIGAVAGGIIGALTESGIPEEEAHYYAEGVRRGHVLVTVRADDSTCERARGVMDRFGAVDVEGRATGWRDRGWTSHNPGAEPLAADELRREREYFSASRRQAAEWTEESEEAHPSLPREEVLTAAADKERTVSQAPQPMETASQPASPEPEPKVYRETGSMLGDTVLPLDSDINNPSNYSDSIENNRRRPDPATVRAERGFDRAMDSAVRSARRLGSRVYDSKRK